MDVDPLEHVEDEDEKEVKDGKAKSNLNRWVAVTVAVLATFMGICKVKDDNIVQAMQQAQADKIDNYSWYQARNVREEVARATAAQLTAQLASTPAADRAADGLAGFRAQGCRFGCLHGGSAFYRDGGGELVVARPVAAQAAGGPRSGAAADDLRVVVVPR